MITILYCGWVGYDIIDATFMDLVMVKIYGTPTDRYFSLPLWMETNWPPFELRWIYKQII